ncbi:radical SAM family heme chaperone HemW [Pelagibacterium xiamenense]|uniref:radical SAM family heme chaperone HemW n=1 Tax=Pelagibacterium xiamenense TaxID=2901140 RepID=UPI001E49E910|nr:radical SAM family heme chaperone HemW [Pelagibacterium xiamenense]MCD7058465.1 radical SAM family heme chaperone HemW [Pelagibacterium xiamenense]
MSANSAFGVYIHWPFCAAKCPYCDFNSHVHHGAFDEVSFVEAYTKEIATTAARAPDRLVQSIFFGGGTPSLMNPASVEAILDAVARHWPVADNAEITLEANPTSVEAERFRGYRAAGVNRVSLGVQSLRPEPLARLGRLHSVEDAVAAVRLAQEIFPRSSFDIIYARPEQTLGEWEEELTDALALSAGHLSLYQLTIEQGTRYFDLFHAGKLKMPSEDLSADMFEMTQDLTASYGLPAYEISNHARPGQESRHNLTYWRYGEYAGIGPGAHGRLLINGARHATAAEKMPFKWWEKVMEKGDGLEVDDLLTWDEEGDEYLVMGLRLREGIDPNRYAALSRRSLAASQIDYLKDIGFIETLPNGRLRVTDKGWPVLDAVVADLAA